MWAGNTPRWATPPGHRAWPPRDGRSPMNCAGKAKGRRAASNSAGLVGPRAGTDAQDGTACKQMARLYGVADIARGTLGQTPRNWQPWISPFIAGIIHHG